MDDLSCEGGTGDGADVPGEWWQVYHCAELDQLVALALKHNATIDAAQAALRAAQDFETLSAEGELSLAMPPDVNWMLASTLAQHEILALNQSERGVRFVAAAAIPRFPKASGGYDAVELPAYPA